jgi:asparagine synthase (glutamine-hydrolysing)
MCGITGFIDFAHSLPREEALALATNMADALSRRGPDGSGCWHENTATLAHRRLAVLDPSPCGAQPMLSESGRYVISYNGEIYNHLELRQELGQSFRGNCDTETLLAAIEAWGLETTLEKINGMFAFALWDRQERTLFLARDRLGIKPLYYGCVNNFFLFASELKAFRVVPGWTGTVNPAALGLYLQFGYVPAPHCIYENFHKLPAGCTLKIFAADKITAGNYWSLSQAARKGWKNQFPGDEEEAAGALEKLLDDAVSAQLLSDVSLGTFLSGGVDSSLVTALAARHCSGKLKTFAIGFTEKRFDESEYAKQVARHLGTDHRTLTVTPEMALAIVPQLPKIYDEPFGDASQIPTVLLSRFAREEVTVALSGDGGDEFFGGYPRHQFIPSLWHKFRLLPLPLRQALAAMLDKVPCNAANYSHALLEKILPGVFRHRDVGDVLPRLGNLLRVRNENDLYGATLFPWQTNPVLHKDLIDPAGEFMAGAVELPLARRVMLADAQFYLPDDILTKVDRASMSTGLEARVPLLDHRVAEFALSLPPHMTEGKGLLKKVLSRHLPPPFFDRPKKGFGVPVADWLRGSLKEMASDLLSPENLRRDNFFDAGVIEKKWRTHLSGRTDAKEALWPLLMFLLWREGERRR